MDPIGLELFKTPARAALHYCEQPLGAELLQHKQRGRGLITPTGRA
jgi:hypothetical protein